jgi:hypothetical protein
VLAIGQLLAEEPGRLAIVEPALRSLVADAQPEVRAAAACALTPLLYTDPERALTLFHRAVDQAPGELLGSHYVEHFLGHTIRQDRYPDVSALIRSMTGDPVAQAREAAARQLVLASYRAPEVDAAVDAVLESSDDATRAAAVAVFADNVTFAPRRDRGIAVISAAFHNPAKVVRDTAERAFYQLGNERLADYAPMIVALTDSPALVDGAGTVLHSLESSRQPLPPEVLDLCEAWVNAHRTSISDIATAAGDAMFVVRLTLRMHAQHTEPTLRSRCLDLIDELVVLRAHGVDGDLDTVER